MCPFVPLSLQLHTDLNSVGLAVNGPLVGVVELHTKKGEAETENRKGRRRAKTGGRRRMAETETKGRDGGQRPHATQQRPQYHCIRARWGGRIYPLLNKDLTCCVQTDVPVEDFVRNVWQLKADRLERDERERDLQSDRALVAEYVSSIENPKRERERAPPFVRLLDDAANKLAVALDLESSCPVVFEPLGSKENDRAPDVIAVPAPIANAWRESQDDDPDPIQTGLEFRMVATFVVFEKTKNKHFMPVKPPPEMVSKRQKMMTGTQAGLKRKARSHEAPPRKRRALDATDRRSTGTSSSSPKYRWGSPSTEHTTSTSTSLAAYRRHSRAAAAAVKAGIEAEVKEEGEMVIEAAASPTAGTFVDETPTPRAVETAEVSPFRVVASRALREDVWDAPGNLTKVQKRKPPVLTSDELQAASYASECLADGRRRYVTGFLVRGLIVSLWYHDRMGVVESQEFDIVEKPRLSFLALAVITECNMERFGYEPMLRLPLTLVSPTIGLPMHLDGWEIHTGHGIDADDIMVPGVVKVKIAGDPLYVQPGIVGRGTSVMPVSVIPGLEFAGLEAGTKLVVEFSWPAASRVDPEDGLVRRICKRIGAKEARHIAPMRLSTTLEGARLGLPWMADSLRKLSGSVEERVLRVIVCDRLRPLKDLETLPDFQSVFLDLVRATLLSLIPTAHRVVFKRACVIHRDLSIDDVMFGVTPEGKPYGVLIDSDLAIDVNSNAGVAHAASALHRTGTAHRPSLARTARKRIDQVCVHIGTWLRPSSGSTLTGAWIVRTEGEDAPIACVVQASKRVRCPAQ
ncbi:hypothetical protein HETIRDRAFT_117236 [Heterobasidion irregulare TC 32-1]|uniref:Fungal-type protein kinase domain-containing protein n=1 Tax=Heterobasidion irregulare (strain TC 32-1) TaxID=747525 RepID=W4K1C7_HETIT|nr:uncharacterized protein HETIRDRAFT_117236 [Heterobasidion irregulare TC 32-1]ETW79633.1 hypothetical protein HETIRDRAFT_117236 [Heterobasidion irregulare TC 32-1]